MIKVKENLDNVIKYYLGISIFAYLIYNIAPILSLLIHTPFYSFQRYLALIGLGIIGLDLIFKRSGLKAKYSYFLYFYILMATISSAIYFRYGFKDNLFDLIWMTIFVYLFYSYGQRFSREEIDKHVNFMYKYISIIWLMAVIFSILTYVFGVGYEILANPYGIYNLTRQGFLEHRLFGIFMSINVSAIFSGILIIYGFLKYPRKISVQVMNVIFFVYIILSGSRSAQLGLFLVVLVYAFYKSYVECFVNKSNVSKFFLSAGLAIACMVGAFGITSLGKELLSKIPSITILQDSSNSFRKVLDLHPRVKVAYLDEVTKEEIKEEVDEETVLDREDVNSGNVSNNRLDIWLDYLSIYKDVSLFGLSPNNYSKFVQDNHSDLFIAVTIKDNHPGMYANGQIYHPHNMPIYAWVSGGVLGILSLAIFFLLKFRDMFVETFINKDKSAVIYSLLVVFCLANSLFDSMLFFSNDLITCIFWLVSGLISSDKKFIILENIVTKTNNSN